MSIYSYVFSSFLYPFYERLRKRQTFKYYYEYKKNQMFSSEEIEQLCFDKYKSLLIYCYENVPYYKEQWVNESIDVYGFEKFSDTYCIPFLTKKIIRERYEELKSPLCDLDSYVKSTGGSSGVPLKFEYSRESNDRRTAVAWRGYEWAGAKIGEKTLYLWGADVLPTKFIRRLKETLYNLVFRRKILNTFDMRRDNIEWYISQINAYKPKIIVAYTTPLVTLAEFIIKHNKQVWSPCSILTGAEALSKKQRELIEKAFKSDVYNTYGSREVMLMASECRYHNGLHLTSDHLYLEVVSEKGVNLEGLQGEVAVTDLHNYAMPFIRYKNGDLATYGNEECKCGLPFPKLKEINGRVLSVVKTKSGIILPGEYFPHLIKDFDDVKAYQVVQESYDEIVVRIKLRDGLIASNQLGLLEKTINVRLDDEVLVKIELVDEFEKTSIGKTLPIISRIKE